MIQILFYLFDKKGDKCLNFFLLQFFFKDKRNIFVLYTYRFFFVYVFLCQIFET